MRHAVFGRKLNRDINSRKALLASLASSVLENGHATTTITKAKFAKGYVEKLVTSAKKNKLNAKRVLASTLRPKAFTRLTMEVAPGFSTRSGGYTRITRLKTRRGDAAVMAKIELMPFTLPKIAKVKKEVKTKGKSASKKTHPKAKIKEKAKGKNEKRK